MSNDFFQNANDFDVPEVFREATRKRRTHLIPVVLFAGLVTSALTLVLIYFISQKMETDVLSILLNFLPIPAVLLGALAGSGYAIACRCSQFRASVVFILFICLVQACVFVGGRYMGYLSLVNEMKSLKFEDVYQRMGLSHMLLEEPAAKVDPGKGEAPKAEAAKVESGKGEAPKAEAAKVEPGKAEAPKAEAAKVEPGKGEAPKVQNDKAVAKIGVESNEPGKKLSREEQEKILNEIRERLTIAMQPPTFWQYYQTCMENISLTKMNETNKAKKDEKGFDLGKAGYLFELYIMLAFCLASTIGLWVVLAFPYCRRCARYLVKTENYFYPCRAPYVKIKKKDTEALEAFAKQDSEIMEQMFLKVEELLQWFVAANTADTPLTKKQVHEHLQEFYPELRVAQNEPVKQKIPNWIRIDFRECSDCDNWYIMIQMEVYPSDGVGTRLKGMVFLEGGRDGLKMPVALADVPGAK